MPDDYPEASAVQLAAMELLITTSLLYDVSDAAIDMLKASDIAVGSGWLYSLPSDQWVQELAGWESFAWAALQTAIPDYAIGHSVREPTSAAYVRNETTNGEKALCRAQRAPVSGRFVYVCVRATKEEFSSTYRLTNAMQEHQCIRSCPYRHFLMHCRHPRHHHPPNPRDVQQVPPRHGAQTRPMGSRRRIPASAAGV